MPTYEYKCEKCKYKFEKFQSMKAEHLKECPKCKGPVKRLIGKGGGIIFKGSGFYATDYKKGKKPSKKDKGGCPLKKPGEKPPCSDDGICKK